jgi:hypothetical protein
MRHRCRRGSLPANFGPRAPSKEAKVTFSTATAAGSIGQSFGEGRAARDGRPASDSCPRNVEQRRAQAAAAKPRFVSEGLAFVPRQSSRQDALSNALDTVGHRRGRRCVRTGAVLDVATQSRRFCACLSIAVPISLETLAVSQKLVNLEFSRRTTPRKKRRHILINSRFAHCFVSNSTFRKSTLELQLRSWYRPWR